jgi:hypothetical protein
MQNITGFGLSINLIASITFPAGFIINQFADDSDPLDVPSLQIGDSAMGLNGDLIAWSKANPIKLTLDVIPSSDNDINLAILLENNRVGRGKLGAKDLITMSLIYPASNTITLTNGIITDGIPFSPVSSAGRLKSKSYQFTFENRVGG